MNENDLFTQIKNHEWSKFCENINSNHDVNVQDENFNYMIQYIILYNNIKALTTILKYDVMLDWFDNEGRTILYVPIKYGYIEIVKTLLKYDDDNIGTFILDNEDANHNLPIHYALKMKNIRMFDLLLTKSKSTIYDSDGNSLLHLAVQTKKIDFVNSVFKKNINVNSTNKCNETALHIASSYDLNDIINILLSKEINVNIQEQRYGFTALFIALLNNNMYGITEIIKKNPDINIQDYNGNTALHIAIVENNHHAIQLMITNKNIDFNAVNLDGNTYLHLILDKIMNEKHMPDNYNLELFFQNTTLNIQNNIGKTPWHYIIPLKLFMLFGNVFKHTSNNLLINDKHNVTPFSLIKENKNELVEIISESYYNKLKTKIWNEDWENDCNDEKNKKQCLAKINELVTNGIKTVPVKKSSYCLNIEEPQFVSFTTFTGINFDVITSYIQLMKRLPSLSTSITENFSINAEVENYYNKLGIIKDLDNEYLNFEIFWIFQQVIFPTNLYQTLQSFKNSEKQIMAIPIGIEIDIGAHANVLIIDKRHNIIERFEPNGKNEPRNYNYNPDLLDNMLEMYFKKIFDYEYLSPKTVQQTIGFQSLEIYESDKMKKIGDPGGFCVGWCLWYVEQRTKYDIKPDKLSLKLIINIRSKNISFKKLIRLYVNNILETRNNILDQLKIDINDIRNNTINKEQKDNIQKLIKYELIGF